MTINNVDRQSQSVAEKLKRIIYIQLLDSALDYSNAIDKAKRIVENLEEPFKVPAFTVILTELLTDEHASTNIEKRRINPEQQEKSKEDVKNNSQIKPGPKAWIRELIDEDFFKQPRRSKEILEVLNERGHVLSPQDITNPLASLVNEKLLRRNTLKPEGENKEAIHWVNW